MKRYGASGWLARVSPSSTKKAPILRLFVAGDRSQVGKSSCCLGIISSLLEIGYKPEEVAFIKPATQCESTQPIQIFCEAHGIDCVGIGPVVFYSGFTREFLNGNLGTSDDLLDSIEVAVDKLCAKPSRRIVIIDGVGFPAVGSIVGLSNATVASRLNAPVLLVCPSGVGNAIDSFVMNDTFFRYNSCKVLGVIFNRFPLEGYYALEKCRPSIKSFFDQFRPDVKMYGLLPSLDLKEISDDEKIGKITTAFKEGVDMVRLLADLKATFEGSGCRKTTLGEQNQNTRPIKRKADAVSLDLARSRIEKLAKASGASGG